MQPRAERSGFTLLEAIVGLAIVGAIIAGGLAAAAADIRATATAVDHVRAAALADHALARGQLLVRDSPSVLLHGTGGRFPPPLDRFRWRLVGWRVTGTPGLVEVHATIRWTAGTYDAATRMRVVQRTPAMEAVE